MFCPRVILKRGFHLPPPNVLLCLCAGFVLMFVKGAIRIRWILRRDSYFGSLPPASQFDRGKGVFLREPVSARNSHQAC